WLWRKPAEWSDLNAARLKAARVAADGQRFDRVHAFRLAVAPYALEVAAAQPQGVRCELDLDDIESLTFARLGGLARRNGDAANAADHERNARAYARAERKLLPRFARLYVC